MYIEIDALLDTMLQQRKIVYLMTIIGLIAIFAYVQTIIFVDPQKLFITQEEISINKNSVPKTGSNNTYYFTFFSDSYMKIPKNNSCAEFQAEDFKTWCSPNDTTLKY